MLRAPNEKDAIDYAKTCFPCPTPSRFSPIQDAKGEIVPNAYAGNSDRLALWEIVLRNIRHAGIRRVPTHETQDRYLVQVKPKRKFTLLDVRRPKDTALVKAGTRPPDLTQAWPSGYKVTRVWAQALRNHLPGIDGLIYESHQIAGDCIVLFQEEPDTEVFEVIGAAQSVRQEPVRSQLLTEVGENIAIDFGDRIGPS